MGDDLRKKRKRSRRSKEKIGDSEETNKESTLHTVKKYDEPNLESDVKMSADDADVEVKMKNEVKSEESNANEDDADDDEPKKRKRKRKRKNKAVTSETNNTSTDNTQETTTSGDATSNTVFIEGLPFTSTPSNIRYFFEQHGCSNIVEMRLPTWQDSGRLRGFGHVVFGTSETKRKALEEVNGKELGGRYITVQEAKAPRAGTTAGEYYVCAILEYEQIFVKSPYCMQLFKIGGMKGSSLGTKVREQPERCKTVFVRNLPYEATEEDMLENFRVCGKILEGGVRIARNHSTGQSKGFGYVEYKNAEGAYAAVHKASKPFGLKVNERPVFVDYDEGSMKGSFRNKDGRLWSKEHGEKGGRGRSGDGRVHKPQI